MDLLIEIIRIKGHCPVFQLGDRLILKEGYQLIADGPVCMHALSALMPFYNALRVSSPSELGLAGLENKEKAYVQCPDAAHLTGGGTVFFEISKQDHVKENS